MNWPNRLCLVCILAACTCLSGCFLGGKKPSAVRVPPPKPAPQATPVPQFPTVSSDETASSVPDVAPQQPSTARVDPRSTGAESAIAPQPPPKETSSAPAPQTTAAKRKKPVTHATAHTRPHTPAADPAASRAADAEVAPPAPSSSTEAVAQLGQILTAEEKSQLTHNLDQSLSAARGALAKIAGHQMTTEESDTASRVIALLSQAEAARESDLSVAAQMARRAELLARSLSNSIH